MKKFLIIMGKDEWVEEHPSWFIAEDVRKAYEPYYAGVQVAEVA